MTARLLYVNSYIEKYPGARGGRRRIAGRLSGTLRLISLLACALVAGLTLSHVLQAPGSRGWTARCG